MNVLGPLGWDMSGLNVWLLTVHSSPTFAMDTVPSLNFHETFDLLKNLIAFSDSEDTILL